MVFAMSFECEKCSADAELYTHIAGSDGGAGYRIFECKKCGHFTWQKWSRAVQQQQQRPHPE